MRPGRSGCSACKPQAFAHLTFREDILVLEINLAAEDTNLERSVARISGRFENAIDAESEDCANRVAFSSGAQRSTS
jgi:hypothetical protein